MLEIYVTIGLDKPVAAERFYDRLERKAEMLRRQPRLGPRRSDVSSKARMLLEGAYLILYEITPDTDEDLVETIEIVRVVDGRRDLRELV